MHKGDAVLYSKRAFRWPYLDVYFFTGNRSKSVILTSVLRIYFVLTVFYGNSSDCMVPPPLSSPLRRVSFLGVDSVPVPRRMEEAVRKMFKDPDEVCTSNYLVKKSYHCVRKEILCTTI